MNQDGLVADHGGYNYDPELIALRGYLDSSNNGLRRLYLEVGLSEYVELNEADVADAKKVPPSSIYPFESTVIWIKAGTDVKYVYDASSGLQAQFLSGAIATTYLTG